VKPGDTLEVLPGNYTGFNIVTSGTAALPITYKAEAGAVINHPMSWGGIEFGINASGKAYNIIDGFTIVAQPGDPLWYAGIRMEGTGTAGQWVQGNVIRNNIVQMRVVKTGDTSKTYDQLGIFTSWQDGVLVEKNTVSGGWDSGIYMSNSARNYTIRGNTVFNIGGNGIHNNGDAGQGGPGINTNALIEKNVIHDVGFGIGGQAISGDGLQNSRIQNNVVYRTYSKGISLYVVNAAGGSKGNVVVNNTVLTGVGSNTGVCLKIDSTSPGNKVFNNIFYNTVAGGWVYEINQGGDSGGADFDYNVIMDPVEAGVSLNAWHGWGWDKHSLLATPAQLFTNVAGNDYSLKAGSPAIEKGSASNAPTTDISDRARPQGAGVAIGAYEYAVAGVGSPPTPAPGK
jgi:hypothetical protein